MSKNHQQQQKPLTAAPVVAEPTKPEPTLSAEVYSGRDRETWFRIEQVGRGVKLFSIVTQDGKVTERKQVGPEDLPFVVLDRVMAELESTLPGRGGK